MSQGTDGTVMVVVGDDGEEMVRQNNEVGTKAAE